MKLSIYEFLISVKKQIAPMFKLCYMFLNLLGITVVPILTFHCFAKDENKKNNERIKNDRWYASIDVFEEQIKWLVEHKYTFINIDMLEKWLLEGEKIPKKSILLTFDDGVKSQLDLVVPILKKYNAKGSCFVIGKHWLNQQEKMPINVIEDDYEYFNKEYYYKDIDNLKYMEIQSHTYNLHYRINGKTAVCLGKDIDVSLDCEKMVNNDFKYIALPYGSYGRNTVSILRKYYKLAFAFDKLGFPYILKKSNIFKLNRIRIDGNSTTNILKKYLY